MNARRRLLAIGLACCALLAACSYSVTHQGGNPTDLIDWDDVADEAARAGSKQHAKIEASAEVFRLSDADPIVGVARTAFANVTEARRVLMIRRPREISDWDSPLSTVRSQSRGAPKLLVLASDQPLSVTYPDQTILMTRRMIDGLSGQTGDASDWTLRFIVAHELVHHHDGHAIFNWVVTSGQRKVAPRAFLTALSKFTRHGPLSFSYDYAPSEVFEDMRHHAVLFEFLADYWAYYILQEMGAPRGAAFSALTAVRELTPKNARARSTLEQSVRIHQRSQCMALLDTEATLGAEVELHSFDSGGVIATQAMLNAQLERTRDKETGESRSFMTGQRDPLNWYGGASNRKIMPDDAYWACAYATLAPDRYRATRKGPSPFDSDDPRQIAAAFTRLASDTQSKGGLLGYYEDLDSIPLLEAGRAFRTPRPDLRPNLAIRKTEYQGYQDGYHQAELEVTNSGHNEIQTPVAITVQIDGAPVPAYHCRPTEDPATLRDCAGAVYTRPVTDSFLRDVLTLYFPAPAVLPRERRLAVFKVDGCDASPLSECAVSETNENDNTSTLMFGALPDLYGVGMSSGSGGYTLNIKNGGYTATTGPFEIIGYRDGQRIEITHCTREPIESAQDGCEGGVWVRKILQPGEEVTLRFQSPDKSARRVRFRIDDCAEGPKTNTRPPRNICAIDELDEGNNEYGALYE